MFTGIVREIGLVEGVERGEGGARLRVGARLAAELAEGDSIAVSGACLTVASTTAGAFEADVMNQTLALTTLGQFEPEAAVNLEPALRAGEPMGGHFVQGHVDGTGEVVDSTEDGFSRRVRVTVPNGLERFLVERGSIAVDGVSLTVVAASDDAFEVALIPETLDRTTLGRLAVGDRVNLEMDMIARHVERLVQGLRRNDAQT